MKKLLLSFFSLCGLMNFSHTTFAQSQGSNFAMYNYAPTLNNAAMLGSSDELMVKYGYRHQPIPAGQSFNTHLLTVGVPIYFGAEKHSRLTLGGSLVLDEQSKFFKTNGLILNASYTVRLNERNYLGAGFQTGFSQRGVNFSGSTESQYDAVNGIFNSALPAKDALDGQNKSFASLDAGLLWTMRDAFGDDKIFLGISSHGFNAPNVSLVGDTKDKLAARLVTIGGVTVFHKNHISIVPNFRLMNQAGKSNLNVGSWFRYGIGDIHQETQRKLGSIGLGLWYMGDGGLITSLELHQPKFFASIAYTLATSDKIQTVGGNVVELCLGMKIRKKDKVIIKETGTNP
jgi:type IX secretion system PorP/SprF family membrane protein